jgi:hypothetical protein
LTDLSNRGIPDIGEHLYASWRCAIAHADVSSWAIIVDADSFADGDRIFKELPLIKEMADIYMKEELVIPDSSELSRINLLKWFGLLFWDNFMNTVSFCQEVPPCIFPTIPMISFKLYKNETYWKPFRNLEFKVISAGKWKVLFSNFHQHHSTHLSFTVDFLSREIAFDINHVQIDSEHDLFDREFELDWYIFLEKYYSNGRLEMWNVENKQLLTRLDAFIPMNVRINHDWFRSKIASLSWVE